MQPAGGVEHGLRRAQPVRAATASTDRADDRPVGDRRAVLLDLVERRLAAEAAARVGDERGARGRVEVDRPPQLDTVTTLYSCSPSPARQYATVSRSSALPSTPSVRQKPTASSKSLPGVRMVTASGCGLLARAVHADLHRLLGDELVGLVEHAGRRRAHAHAHRRHRATRRVRSSPRHANPGRSMPKRSASAGVSTSTNASGGATPRHVGLGDDLVVDDVEERVQRAHATDDQARRPPAARRRRSGHTPAGAGRPLREPRSARRASRAAARAAGRRHAGRSTASEQRGHRRTPRRARHRHRPRQRGERSRPGRLLGHRRQPAQAVPHLEHGVAHRRQPRRHAARRASRRRRTRRALSTPRRRLRPPVSRSPEPSPPARP